MSFSRNVYDIFCVHAWCGADAGTFDRVLSLRDCLERHTDGFGNGRLFRSLRKREDDESDYRRRIKIIINSGGIMMKQMKADVIVVAADCLVWRQVSRRRRTGRRY